jgi:hypothetical protein
MMPSVLLAEVAPGTFGGLDTMTGDMIAQGRIYEAASLKIGLALFATLAVAGAAMYFWRYQNEHQTLHGVEAGAFAAIKNISIPFAIMIAVGAFVPTITSVAESLSGNITGVPLSGPSGIMALGINLAAKVISQPIAMVQASLPPPVDLGPVGAMTGINATANGIALAQHGGSLAVGVVGTLLAALIAIFVIIPSFAIIALEYIVAIANIAIVLSINVYQAAWSAAPGTAPMAERYYGKVNSAVSRLIAILAVAGFIEGTIKLWASYTSITDLSQMVFALLKVAGGSIICAGLAVKLPALAAEAADSSPSVTGADLVGAAKQANANVKTAGSNLAKLVPGRG